jgi:hypothetical protein
VWEPEAKRAVLELTGQLVFWEPTQSSRLVGPGRTCGPVCPRGIQVQMSVLIKGDVRFEVSMAVTMKNGVFWDLTPCGSYKNRRFEETYHLHKQGDKSWWTILRSVRPLLVTANVVPSSQILVTLMMEVITSVRRLLVTANVVPSSQILVTLMTEVLSYVETSVLTRSTRRNIPENVILHN